ncbi:hypothetical protein SAY87_030802 [Trapa incisa]|uniref:Uncharacterized protein n=1 Tax=Trapa incisa TaxID=236973 RepID=A0AAN7QNQ7_9MYRT|nr:hypothetical protein SAY87_030802 [Trapa incisa]
MLPLSALIVFMLAGNSIDGLWKKSWNGAELRAGSPFPLLEQLQRTILARKNSLKRECRRRSSCDGLWKKSWNGADPESVIKPFEQRDLAVDSRVAEYLRVLIVSNGIVEYLPNEQNGRNSSLPTLLDQVAESGSNCWTRT